jgi:anti-anti-sigma factor
LGDLKITQSDVDGVSHAKRVELEGAIDATSIADLTGLVDVLFSGATRWFLVDMRGIKYVNSTGLGSLVKYADSVHLSGWRHDPLWIAAEGEGHH